MLEEIKEKIKKEKMMGRKGKVGRKEAKISFKWKKMILLEYSATSQRRV